MIQQGALGGLPTQVNLLPVGVANSNDLGEDDVSNQDGGQKRGSESDNGDELPPQRRKRVRGREEVEIVIGGISKLVEFCSKDIKCGERISLSFGPLNLSLLTVLSPKLINFSKRDKIEPNRKQGQVLLSGFPMNGDTLGCFP